MCTSKCGSPPTLARPRDGATSVPGRPGRCVSASRRRARCRPPPARRRPSAARPIISCLRSSTAAKITAHSDCVALSGATIVTLPRSSAMNSARVGDAEQRRRAGRKGSAAARRRAGGRGGPRDDHGEQQRDAAPNSEAAVPAAPARRVPAAWWRTTLSRTAKSDRAEQRPARCRRPRSPPGARAPRPARRRRARRAACRPRSAGRMGSPSAITARADDRSGAVPITTTEARDGPAAAMALAKAICESPGTRGADAARRAASAAGSSRGAAVAGRRPRPRARARTRSTERDGAAGRARPGASSMPRRRLATVYAPNAAPARAPSRTPSTRRAPRSVAVAAVVERAVVGQATP